MTGFVLFCAVMVLIALALLALPLLHTPTEGNARKRVTVAVLVVLIPAVAALMYVRFSNWSWSNSAQQAQTGELDINAMVSKLEQRLKTNPRDTEGWLMLGRSYVNLGRYALATNAYQQAYELTQGKNVDAIVGLAESLVLTDEASLAGKAGQLIDEALVLQPTHPKALWYGGLAALRSEKLALARDRFQSLLALNPPEQVRTVLEREVQDLNQQLGAATASTQTQPVAVGKDARKIRVSVTLAPAIKRKLTEPLTLFVLAREPGKGGPPLAVVRHTSTELPLTVELTEANAMLPTMTIANAAKVEVVARLSKSGVPTEQSGDYAGLATYSFAEQGAQGSVNIEINRAVP